VSRAVIVFPGRGAYTAAALGSLDAGHRFVREAEQLREQYGLPSLVELDRADRFDPQVHLQPAHSAPLTFLTSLLDAEKAGMDHDPVAVVGNSLGWYTALAATAALRFSDGFRLVQEVANLQQQRESREDHGGQVIYPLTDAAWRRNPALENAVTTALGAGDGEVFRSVDLGGYTVLAGSEAGVGRLLATLPPVTVGERRFPLRLALQGPDHGPLAEEVATAAASILVDLRWQAPDVTLIDGRGVRFTPWSTDPAQLAAYTLDEQLTTAYDFATSLRVALREYAPDVLILPGPGNSLGAICGQIIVAEGYHGVRSRSDFEAVQRSASPLVLSMRR